MTNDVAIIRRRDSSVRPLRGASRRWRWASTRYSPRWPMPASSGRTSVLPPAAVGQSPTPDAIVGMVGLFRHPPSQNVFNACATSAQCSEGLRLTESGWATTTSASQSAWTSTPAVAFTRGSGPGGAWPAWYAENGQYLTTQFFGMKANRYLHDHGHLAPDAGEGGE